MSERPVPAQSVAGALGFLLCNPWERQGNPLRVSRVGARPLIQILRTALVGEVEGGRKAGRGGGHAARCVGAAGGRSGSRGCELPASRPQELWPHVLPPGLSLAL